MMMMTTIIMLAVTLSTIGNIDDAKVKDVT